VWRKREILMMKEKQTMNKVQEEILLILQEECAEVIQAISKVKRFGQENNIEQLEQEVADVLCMIDLAYQHGILEKNEDRIKNRITVKQERLKKYSSIYETA
jgi:NTP pyrophosphatase (non-canonical NTP hydrolase)